MEEKLKLAINKTKEYGREFGVEYTDEEIGERLISDKIYINFKLQSSNYNNIEFEKKMKRAKEVAEKMGKKFSDVLFIGVTGSVAAGRPQKNCDIDLMIITKKNTLWITRLLLRFWVWRKSIPHRKYGQPEKPNEFCFNLWMEIDKLCLPGKRQNLRNAMDLILMKPVLNRENTYERFILENGWAKKWVATGYNRLVQGTNPPTPTIVGVPSLDKEGKAHKFWAIANWLVFWPQWWYMKRKIAGGLVDRKNAFFHPKADK